MGHTRQLAVVSTAVAMLALSACSSGGSSSSESSSQGGAGGSITFRLWDEQAAAAYKDALPAFEKETGISVDIQTVSWADYWTTLRNDIAAGDAPDVFWTNSSNYVDYAQAGKLLNIDEAIPAGQRDGWLQAAVDQFTVDGTLYGVPAMTDSGIGVFYNKALLDAAGVTVEEIQDLAWDPTANSDSLREITEKLTVDSAGKTAADADFAPDKTVQYGYNAALDIQAIFLNFLGSNGAHYQKDDGTLDFDTDEGVQALQYVVDLINTDHVAPSAADTNDNGDFSRDQFLQGKMALFQTGSYNLANIKDGASFEWGIVELPKGPAGRISVTNSIVAAGSTTSSNAEAQKTFLEWLAGPEAGTALGLSGVGLPANTTVQDTWTQYWSTAGVDVSPLVDVLSEGTITAPFGAKIQGAMEAQNEKLKEVFLGREDVATGVAEAQKAANAVFTDQ